MKWLKTVVGIYGVINIAGGAMGFAMAGSVMSLVVGSGFGLLILFLLSLTTKNPGLAWRSLGFVTLALGGFWVYRLQEVTAQDKSTMIPTMNIALSVAVFICLGVGHMLGSKTKSFEG